jgi:hypothetical protein
VNLPFCSEADFGRKEFGRITLFVANKTLVEYLPTNPDFGRIDFGRTDFGRTGLW